MILNGEVEEWKKKLKPKHRAVLRALCEHCATVDTKGNWHLAVHMHVRSEAVQSKLEPQFRKKVKTVLDRPKIHKTFTVRNVRKDDLR